MRALYYEYGLCNSLLQGKGYGRAGILKARCHDPGLWVQRGEKMEPVYFRYDTGDIWFHRMCVQKNSVQTVSTEGLVFYHSIPNGTMERAVPLIEAPTPQQKTVVLFPNLYSRNHADIVKPIRKAGYSLLFCRERPTAETIIKAFSLPNVTKVLGEVIDGKVRSFNTEGIPSHAMPIGEALEPFVPPKMASTIPHIAALEAQPQQI